MRSLTWRPRLAWLLIAVTSLALVAVACDDNDDVNDLESNGTIPGEPAVPGDPDDEPFPAAPNGGELPAEPGNDDDAAAEPPPDLDPIASGALEPAGGSNVTGLVELSELEGVTALDAAITGLPEGEHFGRVYIGSCDEIGDLAFDLGIVEHDEDEERVEFLVRIEAPVENIADAHVFVVEDGDGELQACAEFALVDEVDDPAGEGAEEEDGLD